METIIFDGKKLASEIEADLKQRVLLLSNKPRLAIVLSGSDEASLKYVEMKRKTAERIGVEVKVFERLPEVDQKQFDGVMVQLPSSEDLNQIDPEKDVDGQNPMSEFVPATVKAIEKVLDRALLETEMDVDDKLTIAVVGSKGNVGTPLVSRMKMYGMNVSEFDLSDGLNLKGFKIIISCTGKSGLIKKDMVDEGIIAIDVGYPKGDFEEDVSEKAAFFTPVPNGVGPMTVISLLDNVVKSAENI